MNINPLSGTNSPYIQSLLSSSLSSANSTSGSTGGTSGVLFGNPQDSNQLSPFAQLLSTLQQLQQSNPTEYQQITQQIATKAPPYMGNNKKKSKHNSNGSRAGSGRVGTAALGRSVERCSTKGNNKPASDLRTYSIPDYRLEHPDFTVRQHIEKDRQGHEHVRYEVEGNLDAPVPPIRDSKYLDRKQCIEIYRWMLLNRKMEVALENLYKQGKVVGGVYFGLGQEACSCASAYALDKDD